MRGLKRRLRNAAVALLEALETRLESRIARREKTGRAPAAGGGAWFTAQERRAADALAAVILPSDALGPGAREAEVAQALDRLVSSSPDRQTRYARGLRALDDLAHRRSGRPFADLPDDDQIRLVAQVEASGTGPLGSRLPMRLTRLYVLWRLPAADFLPEFVNDVFEVFYTSRVGWEWLGYDGPPMPLGYLDPTRPRT